MVLSSKSFVVVLNIMNFYLYPTLGRTNLVYFKLKNSLYLQIQYDIIEKNNWIIETGKD